MQFITNVKTHIARIFQRASCLETSFISVAKYTTISNFLLEFQRNLMKENITGQGRNHDFHFGGQGRNHDFHFEGLRSNYRRRPHHG